MRRFSLYAAVLPSDQQRLSPELRPAVAMGLVLHGGTTIALRLGHRQSAAFNFFTHEALDKNMPAAGSPSLNQADVLHGEVEILTVQAHTNALEGGPVKLSFFDSTRFGRVNPRSPPTVPSW
jgi:hypothetical protein